MIHEVDFEVYEIDGEKAVRVSSLAKALGYSSANPLNTLIRRKPREFQGKVFDIKLMSNSPGAPEAVLTYHGVIRATYLAKTKRSEEFRDWADDVLFKVMTTGFGCRGGRARRRCRVGALRQVGPCASARAGIRGVPQPGQDPTGAGAADRKRTAMLRAGERRPLRSA